MKPELGKNYFFTPRPLRALADQGFSGGMALCGSSIRTKNDTRHAGILCVTMYIFGDRRCKRAAAAR
jgi:hypothetical protein